MQVPFATNSFKALRATHDSNPEHIAYAVHFALRPRDIDSLPEEWPVAVDGDGWHVWGEPYDEAPDGHENHELALHGELNDGKSYHVVMYSTNAGSAVARILAHYGTSDLVAVKGGPFEGRLIATTDFDDWSEQNDEEYVWVSVGGPR